MMPTAKHEPDSKSPSFKYGTISLSFASALLLLLGGGQVSRREWNDERIRLKFIDDQLMIYKTEDDLFHPLILSIGDVQGKDWFSIVEEMVQ